MKDRKDIKNLRGVFSDSTASRDAAALSDAASVVGIVAKVDPVAYVEEIPTEETPEEVAEKIKALEAANKVESEEEAEKLGIETNGLTKDQIIEKIAESYEDTEVETKPRKVEPHLILNLDQALELFGEDSEMYKLIKIVRGVGVSRIIAAPVIGKEVEGDSDEEFDKDGYKKALDLLYSEDIVEIVITDTANQEFHQEIKEHCEKACKNEKERRAHVGGEFTEEEVVQGIKWIEQAKELNSGLVTLWGNTTLDVDGKPHGHSIYLAAVVAAYDALETDPAMPLHEIRIDENLFGGLANTWDAEDRNEIYGSGVAGAITVNGQIIIDRWVTTYTEDRSKSIPEPDETYQEGTVAKVENHISKGLREHIRELYPREKSTPRVVSRIETDAVMWLKGEEDKEIIEEPKVIDVYRDPKDRRDIHVIHEYYVVLPLIRVLIHSHAIV